MIKAHELAIPYSCLNKAAATEPIFVLRASDPLFAQTVRLWAAMAHGVHEDDKRDGACRIAEDGEAWRNSQPTAVLA